MHIFTKMKKPLYQEVEIPEGVEVNLNDAKISVKGKEGEIQREFKIGKLNLKKEGNKIIIGYEKSTKNEKKLMNTIASHIRNMIQGVQEKFEYQLKVCSGHFPMTVKVEGDKAIIKNFFGEKIDRVAQIPKGAEIEVKKDRITIKSINKEIAGQAAANFEAATVLKKKDRRIFQDGIYIVNKAGREI